MGVAAESIKPLIKPLINQPIRGKLTCILGRRGGCVAWFLENKAMRAGAGPGAAGPVVFARQRGGPGTAGDKGTEGPGSGHPGR